MDMLLSIAMGLGLAAACGFRVFVPLLVMSLASRGGHLDLATSFEWIASTPAMIAFVDGPFFGEAKCATDRRLNGGTM